MFLLLFRQVLMKPRLALNLLVAKDDPKLLIFHLSRAVFSGIYLQSLAHVVLGTH